MNLPELRLAVLILLQLVIGRPLGARLVAHVVLVLGVAAAHELQLVVAVRVDHVRGVVARGDVGPEAAAHVDDFYGGLGCRWLSSFFLVLRRVWPVGKEGRGWGGKEERHGKMGGEGWVMGKDLRGQQARGC